MTFEKPEKALVIPADHPATDATATLSLHSSNNSKRKLWQLPGACHCMIIGTCLSMQDVKTIARKCKFSYEQLSDYELHRFFVAQASHSDSLIARRTQTLLDTRYKIDLNRVRGKHTETELLAHWNILRDTGRIACALWAIVTHANCTTNIVEKLYGEVHMLSHLSGASVHKQAAALPGAQVEINELKAKIKRQQQTASRKIDNLQVMLGKLEATNTKLRQRLGSESIPDNHTTRLLKQDHRIVKSALKDTNALLKDSRAQVRNAEREVLQHESKLHTKDNQIEKLEQFVDYLLQKESQPDAACENSLSGKCLLLLGGMPSQCKHFKAFVESNNGDFLHHDGGVESRYSQIDQLVSQADAVLCPVEQVSHAAMQRAKKLCKSADKPLVFLPQASLSAFIDGVNEIAETQ